MFACMHFLTLFYLNCACGFNETHINFYSVEIRLSVLL